MASGKQLHQFEGGNALSEFRARALLERLRSAAASIESVRARFIHVVWSDAPLDRAARDLAEALLKYGEPFETSPCDASFVVAPRLGTVSPWASKATDIARNCGLGVHRIERVVEYRLGLRRRFLGGAPTLAAAEHAAIARLLHDPMTESVLDAREHIAAVFEERAAEPMATVDVGDGGRALAAATGVSAWRFRPPSSATCGRPSQRSAARRPTSS